MNDIPDGATHRAVYHIKNQTTYAYYKQDENGHWLYFSKEFHQWARSMHSELWFKEVAEPIPQNKHQGT